MNGLHNFKYNLSTIREIIPEDIYPNLSIPSGWEVIAFRPPVEGDKFWGVCFLDASRVLTYASDETWSCPQTPRLILKKANEVIPTSMTGDVSVGDIYKNDVVIPEGWKFQRFGLPVAGDYYLNRGDPRMREYWDRYSGKATSPRIIVTKA